MKNPIRNLLRRLQVILFLVIVTGMTCCTVQEYAEKVEQGAKAYEAYDSIKIEIKQLHARFDSIEQGHDTITPADHQRMNHITSMAKSHILNSPTR